MPFSKAVFLLLRALLCFCPTEGPASSCRGSSCPWFKLDAQPTAKGAASLCSQRWVWVSDCSTLQMFNKLYGIYIIILLSSLIISFHQAVVMESRCLCYKRVVMINNKHLIRAALICSSSYWIQNESSFPVLT